MAARVMNPQADAAAYEEYYRTMPGPPPPQPLNQDYYGQQPMSEYRPQPTEYKPTEYKPQHKKVIIEEVYPKGHSVPPQYTNARFQNDSDDDSDYEVKVRRQIVQPRARSVDSGPTARSRGSDRGSKSGSRRGGNSTRRRSAYDSDTDTEDDDDSDNNNNKKQDNSKALIRPVNSKVHPCSTNCPDNANRNVGWTPPRAFPLPNSDDEYSSSEDEKEQKTRRNKRRVYKGLAVLSTVGAGATFYNHFKAAKTRREALQKGEMCTAEYKNQRNKMIAEDALAGVIFAVGVNNMVKGWRRTAELRKQDDECRRKWDEMRSRRDLYEHEETDVEDEQSGRKSNRNRSARRRQSR